MCCVVHLVALSCDASSDGGGEDARAIAEDAGQGAAIDEGSDVCSLKSWNLLRKGPNG